MTSLEPGDRSSRTLVLFVHGFGGSAKGTWGGFEDLISTDPRLSHVDTRFYEFPTGLRHFFRRKPRVQLLADGLQTEIRHRYAEYDRIVLVAHSLGGLVARRYVLDRLLEDAHDDAARPEPFRIAKLLLFAVPNDGAGLAKAARIVARWDPQIRQLCRRSDFLDDMNREWEKLGAGSRVQVHYVVAGQDAVVNEASARGLQGVGPDDVEVIAAADHRSCVKPVTRDDLAYCLTRDFVLAPTGPRPARGPGAFKSLKVVGFDLDGTLLRGITFSWTRVWEHLGYPRDMYRAGMKRYLSEQCTYDEWTRWAVEKFRARKLTKEQLEELADGLTVTKNLVPAVTRLRDAGLRLAIISGGIDTFLNTAIPNASELFDDIYINRLRFDEDGVVCDVDPTTYDFLGKIDALERSASLAGCTLANAVFVGDGFNDARVSGRAALSIAYPPTHEEQSSISDVQIAEDDLMLVANTILEVA